ncbi:MAG: hypothetical protein H7331_04345 [Bacteroidia bacterium]|nr:hypothetical protein [Bacteroidia bacterium]
MKTKDKSKDVNLVIQSVFEEAVKATKDIKTGYNTGLQAFGKDSDKIKLKNTTLIQGSVNLDKCLESKYPNDNRWDYCFAYTSKVYFIEVHTANTREVRTMLNKLKALKDWLNTSAPHINKLKAKQPYFWVQSNKFNIPKGSSQYRQIITQGLEPIPLFTDKHLEK